MPKMDFSLSINRFKKGEKSQEEYNIPQAIYYSGDIKINKFSKRLDTILHGKKGELPVFMIWDSPKRLFVVVNRPRKKVRFELKTETPTGETPSGLFGVIGQDPETSKFVSWSAWLEIFSRKL